MDLMLNVTSFWNKINTYFTQYASQLKKLIKIKIRCIIEYIYVPLLVQVRAVNNWLCQ